MPDSHVSDAFGSSEFVLPIHSTPKPIQTISPVEVSKNTSAAVLSTGAHPSAYHAFLYLVQFWALSSVAYSVGAILFQIINKVFPETLDRGYASLYFGMVDQYVFKYAIASLIVAGPVYFLLSLVIARQVRGGNIPLNSKVRSWISYIILFLVTAIMIGDLISLLYVYLGGDLVTRTVFKSLVVLGITGFIFVYYFLDLKRKGLETNPLFGQVFFGIGLVVTLGTLLSAFFYIDGPNTTRYKQADQKTLTNIQTVQGYIDQYAAKNNKLPDNLDNLKEEGGSTLNRYSYVQPETWKDLTYNKKGESSYALCGDFKRSNRDDKEEGNDTALLYKPAPFLPEKDASWQHDKGHYCFDRSVTLAPSYNDLYEQSSFGAQQPEFRNSWLQQVPVTSTPSVSSNTNLIESLRYAAQVPAISCKKTGSLVSGKSGEEICEGSYQIRYIWPQVIGCGNGANWVVKNGDKDNWDFTLMCPDTPACSGPENILCSSTQCMISDACEDSPNFTFGGPEWR